MIIAIELVEKSALAIFMPFIFWDDDFLFYDEPGGPEMFLNDTIGLGSVTGSDDCEPVSGSLRKKIGEGQL